MPRRRPDEVVVDPVAAAEQLGYPVAAASMLDVQAETVAERGQDLPDAGAGPPACALGHPNTGDAKFCATCGLAMDAPAPVKADLAAARPRPAAELTTEERAARDRQHIEAQRAAAAFESAPASYVPSRGESITIHFVEDGLTFAGQVWFRGQEITIGPDHPRWPEARGWILLDKYQQVERYGRQYFDRGPWPFKHTYEGAEFERLGIVGGEGSFAGPGEDALRQAEEAERRRAGAVPAPAFGAR